MLSTPRTLTICYMTALSFVALLSIGSHMVVDKELRNNQGSAAIVNLSGRQRMLSQRIVALAAQWEQGDSSAHAALQVSLKEFQSAHDRLASLAQNAGPQDDAALKIRDIYFGSGQEDKHFQSFVRTAREIADTDYSKYAGPKFSPQFSQLGRISRGPLLDQLDSVVRVYQSDSENNIRHLEDVHWNLLVVVLMTLIIEAVFIFRPMISKLAIYLRQILSLLEVDYLTGALNRRAFMERAQIEVSRARRKGTQLSLLMIDIDHFKKINDAHGHPIGDAALISLVTTLQSNCRSGDIFGRFGGEEFCALLPDTDISMARALANKLRQTIAEVELGKGDDKFRITVSIGIAQLSVNQDDALAEAIKRADVMLYLAKDAGRNCVWPPADKMIEMAA